jgi:3-isopropylmalate/(R)-2-methylmalate dehydratase small subunit
MTEFTAHTGTAVPLRIGDVDTDQIIPARFCTNPEKTGFKDALFADWRADPRFVLNETRFRGASVLVAAENFGAGSSREAAVWALADYGFRAVISPRFADIFRGNAWMNGLLAVTAPLSFVERVWQAVEADPSTPVTVDLAALQVRAAGLSHPFEVDADTRDRLLRGVDAIGATLAFEDEIKAYERTRVPTPVTGRAAAFPPSHDTPSLERS